MSFKSNQPIGFYDSGIGGLTVANAVLQALPNEQIIYYGDSLHFPYGEKSSVEIQSYSIEIADFFLQQNCKCIVIACNSASASAYKTVKEFVNNRALVVDVIEPTLYYTEKYLSSINDIGVIATRRTIQSKAYDSGLKKLGLNVHSLATPLLAPMIEEGFVHDSVSKAVIDQYLSEPTLQHIEALVLACTHYPIIKEEIEQFYNHTVNVIDTPTVIAEYLKDLLQRNNLLSQTLEDINAHKFYFSALNEGIERVKKIFNYQFEIEEKNIFQ